MSATVPSDRCHFFLSYAHSAPLADGDRLDTDTDVWVRRCFEDLSAEVAGLLDADPRTVGFVDYLVQPGADWKAMLTDQLGRAEVFVALYSPGYVNKSWPMRERAAFQERVERAFPGRPEAARAHMLAVLWIPFPAGDRIPELSAALSLGAGVPEYVDNGLRALCMLSSYRSQYRKIVNRLAHRIVEVTGRSGLPPSRVIAMDDVPVPDPVTADTPFVIGVLGAAGTYRRVSPAVTPGSAWRPYGAALDPPVAEYVANVAERLGLPTRIVDRAADLKAMDNSPAVILVDPWLLDQRGDEDPLGAVTGHLHPWVTPVVVTDRHDLRYSRGGAELADRTAARLTALGAPRVYTALDVEQLAQLMPSTVSEARRQYLRRASVHASGGFPRPRLGDDDLSAPSPPEKSTDD
jgi:FxsC-like protein